MGWPHEIARLWLNAGAAWIAVGSSSAAPEWISVPEGQQTRRVWRTTAQETWPELLYWSGLLALAAAGAGMSANAMRQQRKSRAPFMAVRIAGAGKDSSVVDF